MSDEEQEEQQEDEENQFSDSEQDSVVFLVKVHIYLFSTFSCTCKLMTLFFIDHEPP